MKIALTEFAKRHFRPDFGGTKVTLRTPEEFEVLVNSSPVLRETEGYASFCKHLFFENFAGSLSGVMEITPDNEHLLRSGFSSRTPAELPVLGRWFPGELVNPPVARFLDVIVYSRAQLETEGDILPLGAEWGIVAILSADSLEETPVPPSAMLRNALGIQEGGSGVPLDREAYLKSVEYWSRHANVK